MRLTADEPVGFVRLPAEGPVPVALSLKVAPSGGPLSIEAWIEGPGRPALRLGAIAPYPAGQAGEFLLGWPAKLGALPPPAHVRLVLKPAAPGAKATVTAAWRQ
jgi:hypothetical protein